VRIISLRVRGERRRQMEEAARAGRLTTVESIDVLTPEAIPNLARQSIWLFVLGAAFYVFAIGLARDVTHAGQLLGDGPLALRVALLIGVNIVGYLLVIPAHEAMHALVILALGGRPRFGLKLPLAAFCTAPNQLFLRDGYIAVALAPLILLSIVALVIAALLPNVAPALLLAVAGNISGAVGDLEVVRNIRKQPGDTLIADTETGYIAYRLNR
jgi:hypothetical protein